MAWPKGVPRAGYVKGSINNSGGPVVRTKSGKSSTAVLDMQDVDKELAKRSKPPKVLKSEKDVIKPEKGVVHISIPRPEFRNITLDIVSVTDLVVNRFGTKRREKIQLKQSGAGKIGREPRVPVDEFVDSLYWLPGVKPNKSPKAGETGFPASGLKRCAVDACKFTGGALRPGYVKGAFHVVGDMIPILGAKPVLREDNVAVQSGMRRVADMRYRGSYTGWRMKVPIRYNASLITPEQIATLLHIGGNGIGIGEWRPERNGQFGMFEVPLNTKSR